MRIYRYLLLIAAVFVCFCSVGQYAGRDKRVKDDADAMLQSGDYPGALKYYRQLSEVHREDTHLLALIGEAMFHLRTLHLDAAPHLKKAAEAGVGRAFYYHAHLLHESGQLEQAELWLLKLLAQPDTLLTVPKGTILNRLAQVRNARQALQEPVAVSIENVGPSINSNFSEHTPIISWDDSTLFFTSRRPASLESEKNMEGEYLEDIYLSKRNENGQWGEAVLVEGLQSKYNDALAGLSFGSEKLVFFRTNKRDLTKGDLYWAELEEGVYEGSEKLKRPINSPHVESGCAFASDGHFIIFSSARPGGYGGMDLWRVVRVGKGIYSNAQNLGPDVNTPYDEIGPFLLPDNKTLYFSSNGDMSIGGFDIFRCRMLDDTTFSEPENLGYPLNTLTDDVFFSLTPNGRKGYFSRSTEGQPANMDIYTTTVPGMNVKANLVRGLVRNSISGEGIRSEIRVHDIATNKLTGLYNTSENGNFLLVLLPTENAVISINEPGFKPYRQAWEYSPGEDIVEVRKDINLEPEE